MNERFQLAKGDCQFRLRHQHSSFKDGAPRRASAPGEVLIVRLWIQA
jgi:hypothetical protein